jgi:predicted HicB family RNase H-like nuclease
MAKSTDYTSKLQGFADRVKSEPVHLPVQKVTPLRPETEPKDEQQLNVWIPKDLMKRLKVKGIETDKSLKEMVIEALKEYL